MSVNSADRKFYFHVIPSIQYVILLFIPRFHQLKNLSNGENDAEWVKNSKNNNNSLIAILIYENSVTYYLAEAAWDKCLRGDFVAFKILECHSHHKI